MLNQHAAEFVDKFLFLNRSICFITGPASSPYFDIIFKSDFNLNARGYYAEYQIFTNQSRMRTDRLETRNVPDSCDPPVDCKEYCYHGNEVDGAGCPTCTCIIGDEGKKNTKLIDYPYIIQWSQ